MQTFVLFAYKARLVVLDIDLDFSQLHIATGQEAQLMRPGADPKRLQ